MKFLFALLIPFCGWTQTKSGAFIIQIKDRSMTVVSPDVKRTLFSVIVENHSLSDQIGKFVVEGKNAKFISVKSGKTESIEFENNSLSNVFFIPVSPAFQDVELKFGKKSYEIPSKK